MLNVTDRKKNILFYGILFLFFSVIFALSPLTVDDTYYKYLDFTSIKDIFDFSAGYGNGRVLGNMLGVILTKSVLLSAVFRSVLVTLLSIVLFNIVKVKDKALNGLIIAVEAFVIIGMSSDLFGMAFSWQSAFCNTIPPLVLSLLCILILKNYDLQKNKALSLIVISASAFFGQFFSENSTVYHLVMFFSLIFINNFFLKRNILPYILSFGFSCAGGLCMFLCRRFYPLYAIDLISVKEYQQFHLGSVKQALTSCIINSTTSAYYLLKFALLFSVLSLEIITVISKNDFKNMKFNRIKPLMHFSAVLFPVYGFLKIFFIPDSCFEGKFRFFFYGILALSLLTYCISILSAIFLIKDYFIKLFFSLSLCFAAFTILPLLVVSPISIRTLIYVYFFVLLAELILLPTVVRYYSKETVNNIKRVITCLVLCAGVYMLTMFISISAMNHNVDSYCRSQMEKGERKIAVCDLTNTGYYHFISPESTFKFKYFNEEPGDIEFFEVDPYEWRIKYFKK